MKKILKLVVFLLILGGLVLGLALYNLNSLISTFTPELERLASEALGAEVNLGRLDAAIFPSARVIVETLTIKNRSEAERGVSLHNFILEVRLLPLLQRRLEITRLSLDQPRIELLSKNGEILLPGMTAEKRPVRPNGGSSKPKTAGLANKENPLEGITVAVERVEITDGSIRIQDLDRGSSTEILGVNFSTGIDLSATSLNLTSLRAKARLSPTLQVDASSARVKVDLPAGPLQAGSEIGVDAPELSLSVNSTPLTIALRAQLRGKELTLEKCSIAGFRGTAQLAAKTSLVEGGPISAQLKVSALDLGELAKVLSPQPPLAPEGTLESVELNVGGKFGPALSRTLVGPVHIVVRDASLKGFNLGAEVLKAVKDIPGLAGSLFGSLPAEQQNALRGDETVISSLNLRGNLADSALDFDALDVTSPLFSLHGAGRAASNGALDARMSLLFTPQLSASLVSRVKEVKLLLNEKGEVVIPFALSGIAPALRVVPDVEKLLQGGVGKLLEEKAGKFLDKVLDGKGKKKGGLGGLFKF